jgi:Flp pilus assembly protein TadG
MRYSKPPGSGLRHGAAAAELAVLLLVLCFILVAVTDFARVFYHYQIITNCARSGALYGSQDSTHATDTTGIQSAALADASDLSPQPTVSSTTGTDTSNNPYVQVTVSYSLTLVVPSYPGISSPVNISRTVQMRVGPTSPSGS